MQNQFSRRFTPPKGHKRTSSIDQGSWQVPRNEPMMEQEPEDTFHYGSPGKRRNYDTSKHSAGGRYNYNNKSFGSNRRQQNPRMEHQSYYISDPESTESHSQFDSKRASFRNKYDKFTHGSDDDYFEYPGESNMTYSGESAVARDEHISQNLYGFGDGSTNMSGLSANFSNRNSFNMNERRMSGNKSKRIRMNSDGSFTSDIDVNTSGNISKNMIGNNWSDNTKKPRNDGKQMSQGSGAQFGNQINSAAVGIGILSSWLQLYSNNQATQNLLQMGRHRTELGFNKSATMSQGKLATDVYLDATNFNQWCFLRKNFHKQDNALAEHLFEIHNKFCHECKERNEERQLRKKKKNSTDQKETEKEVPDEELDEEELEMKNLMGFAGFGTTKGLLVKDNNYKIVTASSTQSSSNEANEANEANESSTLTEAEKEMINLRGGFSVFNKQTSAASPSYGEICDSPVAGDTENEDNETE